MASEIKVDTVSEKTSANGITIDGLNIKDAKLTTANSVVEANMSANSVDSDSYVDGSIDTAHIADGQVTVGKLATAVFTGATDIGAAIVDADLFLMDDGAGGTIRKTTAARLKTYIPGVGKILQAVSVKIDSEVASTSTSFADIGGFTLNITPATTSSKILVSVYSQMYNNDTDSQAAGTTKFLRNVNGGSYSNLSAQGAGLSAIVSTVNSAVSSGTNAHLFPFQITLIDSPSTTTQCNYKIQGAASHGGTARWCYDGMSGYMTALEIGA
jgi:hypothetical protein